MEDDEQGDDEQRAAAAHRTIQIDALTDVELIDHRRRVDGSRGAERSPAGRAPPPLPRKPARSSQTRIAGLVIVALLAGALFAHGVVTFLLPQGAPAASAAAGPPSPETPAGASVRQLRMDDELVIRAAPPAADP